MNKISHIRPLPASLVQRYKGWRATTYQENQEWYSHLAGEGQRPRSMIISCCDSRLHLTQIFGADSGEIFIHRNIANLVPCFTDDGGVHGTSAAVEYAVTELKIVNLMVIGHSKCGGIAGAFELCEGRKDAKHHFLDPWLKLLRPGYERAGVAGEAPETALEKMEKQSVLVSLDNLMTFPFVQEAVNNNCLALHGLWHDIGAGLLYQYSPETDKFEPL